MLVPSIIPIRGRLVDLTSIDCGLFTLNAAHWLNILWLLSGAPFVLGMPWWRCCCEEEVEPVCDHCEEDTAPQEYRLTLDGNWYTTDNCTTDDCTDAIGDWVLQLLPDQALNACRYVYCMELECGVTTFITWDAIRWVFEFDLASPHHPTVYAYPAVPAAPPNIDCSFLNAPDVWQNTTDFTSGDDCSLIDFDLPWVSSSGTLACVGASGDYIHITALP